MSRRYLDAPATPPRLLPLQVDAASEWRYLRAKLTGSCDHNWVR